MSTASALHRAALDGLGPMLRADGLIEPDIAAGRLGDLLAQHEATASNFDSAISLLCAPREMRSPPVANGCFAAFNLCFGSGES